MATRPVASDTTSHEYKTEEVQQGASRQEDCARVGTYDIAADASPETAYFQNVDSDHDTPYPHDQRSTDINQHPLQNKTKKRSTYTDFYQSHKGCSEKCREHFFDAIIYHHDLDRKLAFDFKKYLEGFNLSLAKGAHKPKIELVENIKASPYFSALNECCKITKTIFVVLTKQSTKNSQLEEGIQAIWSLVPATEGLQVIPVLHGFGEDETPQLHIVSHSNFIRLEKDEFCDARFQACLTSHLHSRLHHDAIRRKCAEEDDIEQTCVKQTASTTTSEESLASSNHAPISGVRYRSQVTQKNDGDPVGCSSVEVQRFSQSIPSRENSAAETTEPSISHSPTSKGAANITVSHLSPPSQPVPQPSATAVKKSQEQIGSASGQFCSVPISTYCKNPEPTNLHSCLEASPSAIQNEISRDGEGTPPPQTLAGKISHVTNVTSWSGCSKQKISPKEDDHAHGKSLPSVVDVDNPSSRDEKKMYSFPSEDTLLWSCDASQAVLRSSAQNLDQGLEPSNSIPTASKQSANVSDGDVFSNAGDSTRKSGKTLQVRDLEAEADDFCKKQDSASQAANVTMDNASEKVSEDCGERTTADRLGLSSNVLQDAVALEKPKGTALSQSSAPAKDLRSKENDEILTDLKERQEWSPETKSSSRFEIPDLKLACIPLRNTHDQGREEAEKKEPLAEKHRQLSQLPQHHNIYCAQDVRLTSDLLSDALLAQSYLIKSEEDNSLSTLTLTKTSCPSGSTETNFLPSEFYAEDWTCPNLSISNMHPFPSGEFHEIHSHHPEAGSSKTVMRHLGMETSRKHHEWEENTDTKTRQDAQSYQLMATMSVTPVAETSMQVPIPTDDVYYNLCSGNTPVTVASKATSAEMLPTPQSQKQVYKLQINQVDQLFITSSAPSQSGQHHVQTTTEAHAVNAPDENCCSKLPPHSRALPSPSEQVPASANKGQLEKLGMDRSLVEAPVPSQIKKQTAYKSPPLKGLCCGIWKRKKKGK